MTATFATYRRPPALINVDTEPMPRIRDGLALLPVVRPVVPALQVPWLVLSWTALDLLLIPVAAWLAAGWSPGGHRRGPVVGRHRPAPGRTPSREYTAPPIRHHRSTTATHNTGDTA